MSARTPYADAYARVCYYYEPLFMTRYTRCCWCSCSRYVVARYVVARAHDLLCLLPAIFAVVLRGSFSWCCYAAWGLPREWYMRYGLIVTPACCRWFDAMRAQKEIWVGAMPTYMFDMLFATPASYAHARCCYRYYALHMSLPLFYSHMFFHIEPRAHLRALFTRAHDAR